MQPPSHITEEAQQEAAVATDPGLAWVVHPPKEGRFQFDYPDGTHYSGEWLDRMHHGQGSIQWPSGKRRKLRR